jgi:hypothetical protein
MEDFSLPISYMNAVEMGGDAAAASLEGGALSDYVPKTPTMWGLYLVIAAVIGVIIWAIVRRAEADKSAKSTKATVAPRPTTASMAQFAPPRAISEARRTAAAAAAAAAAASAPSSSASAAAAPAAEPAASAAAAEPAAEPAASAAAAEPAAEPVPEKEPVTLQTLRAGRGRGRATKSKGEITMNLFSRKLDELDAAPVAKPGSEAVEAETSHDVMMRNYSFDKFREAMMSGSPKSILLGEEEDDAHWRATGHTRAAYERHVQPLHRGAFSAEEA